MEQSDRQITFEAEVTERFGILPNFFRSPEAAPELIQRNLSVFREGRLISTTPFPPSSKNVYLSRSPGCAPCATASCATSAFSSATADRQAKQTLARTALPT